MDASLIEQLGNESVARHARLCKKCGIQKPVSEFHRNIKDMTYGCQSRCKVCKNAENTAWRRKNPDKRAASKARSYAANRDTILQQQKKARGKHSDAQKSRLREHRLLHNLSKRYGLTIEEFDALVLRHGGCCGICGKSKKRMVVDHDHKTNLVRGLLCVSCNVGLGLMGDSINGLRRSIAYLNNAENRSNGECDEIGHRSSQVKRCGQRTLGFADANWAQAGG